MPGQAREIDTAVALAIARRDGADLDRPLAATRQILGMKLEQLDRPAPTLPSPATAMRKGCVIQP
jgi:hypothetical protein